MSLHYRSIINVSYSQTVCIQQPSSTIQLYSGCPIVVCMGPAETGKSTSIKAALSLTGKILSPGFIIHISSNWQVLRFRQCMLRDPMRSSWKELPFQPYHWQ